MSTQDQDKNIRMYLNEIGQTPLLTVEEERQLAKRIKRGDQEAKQHMIRANLRLVVNIAQHYSRNGLPLLDLISEGNIGLMKAVERFDPDNGAKMSTYAAWWIKQSMMRALANQSKTIRLPSHIVDKVRRMRRVRTELANEMGREPTDDEVAKELGVPLSVLHHWQRVTLRPTSLDAPLREDEGGALADFIEDERARSPFDTVNERQLMEEVEQLRKQLDPRERDILMYRFGLKNGRVETLDTVGGRFKITRERVRQIQNTALMKVREKLEADGQPA